MPAKTCPKCNKKSEDASVCHHCGINFDEYETSKQEKLIEVQVLLSENKYKEARELAEKLPTQFPDNRNDFMLLLSNINRDISIVEKYEQAQQLYSAGDFNQIALLLRNIKAFDHNLNEKVISLRRKAERYLQNDKNFTRAVDAFESGNYVEAKTLFKQIHGFSRQDEVAEYLKKIADVIGAMLQDAVECIRNKQFEVAREKFTALQISFPDMQKEIEGYVTLLAKRIEIKNNIFEAAKQAKKEKRLLESKILYSYLGLQFPEFLPQIQPHLKEIGREIVVSLADLEESAIIGLSSLGLEAGSEVSGVRYIAADSKEFVPPDLISPDIDGEGNEDLLSVVSNQESTADRGSPPLEIDDEPVADFTY